MRPVLVITHLRDPHLGLVREALTAAGIPVVHRNLFSDKALSPIAEISGIASLGGQMSATDLAGYPFLAAELRLLQDAVRIRLPTIGLCLGAQLLARATNGRIDRMDRPYIGWPRLTFETQARDDPLFHDLPPSIRVIKWHIDAIDPPPSAAILASTGGPGCANLPNRPAGLG
jgi:GMP synthase-like glutamine amidotransferase